MSDREHLEQILERLSWMRDGDGNWTGVEDSVLDEIHGLATQHLSESAQPDFAALIDRYLPPILNGLSEGTKDVQHMDPEDRTPEQTGLIMALSAAHWLAKKSGGQTQTKVMDDWDVPSVLDLMRQVRQMRSADLDEALIRRAIADPGQFTPRLRDLGPEKDERETITAWGARAVVLALTHQDQKETLHV